MTYDRNEHRRYGSDPRSRYGNERDDRGFFDRARDEVSSWFGDDRAEARRDMDERYDDNRRRQSYMSDRDERSFGDSARFRDEGYRRPYTGRFQGRQQFGDDYGPDRAFRNDRWDRGQSQDWARQQRDFTGSASGLYDRDYSSWRGRQIDELDRDYDEFRRENSARFENEFTSWRTGRQAKKQLIQQLDEHMDVVGSDGETVGKIDHIKADKVILTKNDSPDGRHHAIGCSRFDRVEDGKLYLDQPASEIQQGFEQQKRNRALFEDERPDDNGPHLLNRSFSGTY